MRHLQDLCTDPLRTPMHGGSSDVGLKLKLGLAMETELELELELELDLASGPEEVKKQ